MSNFKIKEDKEIPDYGDIQYEYFCMVGDHSFKDELDYPRLKEDSLKCLAKSCYNPETSTSQYFIKFDRKNNMFNPFGLDAIVRDYHSGSILQKYRKVSKDQFDTYLKFLKTRNKAYLHIAQRSI